MGYGTLMRSRLIKSEFHPPPRFIAFELSQSYIGQVGHAYAQD